MAIPRHVAIIMDGNGRWAKERKMPRFMGHRAGAKVVHQIVEQARKNHIETLTLFAFSLENHARPVTEVNYLMSLFLDYLERYTEKLCENQVRLKVIGDHHYFSPALLAQIEKAESKTATNAQMTLVLAIHYSGRWDMAQAMQKIAKKVEQGDLKAEAITPLLIQQHLSTSEFPDPDLLIRTSGEQRMSNFMLWQCAYTELYFTPMHWPSFSPRAFEAALAMYTSRERRFGLTSDQLEIQHA